MKRLFQIIIVLMPLIFHGILTAQNERNNDSILHEVNRKLSVTEQQRISDSIIKTEMEAQLNSLKTTNISKKEELQRKLTEIEEGERERVALKKVKIDSLRNKVRRYPVTGVLGDTLFYIYAKFGASTPKDRAASISKKLLKLYEDDFLKVDSIVTVNSENTVDIAYGEMIIMSISETDALWNNTTMMNLAREGKAKIRDSIISARKENSLPKLLLRIGLVLLVIAAVWLIIWLVKKGNSRLLRLITIKEGKWIRDLKYKDYTFLTTQRSVQLISLFVKFFRWFLYAAILYISLPLLFSIFPFTRGWGDTLFNFVWSPFKGMLMAFWHYIPNLIRIFVIIFVMRYFIRFVKYIFSEINIGNLKISGFHADWAMPTYNIVRFLLYAFIVVLIFPYLPGSDSTIFRGVSVFIGVLFSFGSSSAISNMVAGLVITYMRPFKTGDRISIGDVTGDVLEKTPLVTRIVTIKNEVVTIPNSAVLLGNTINYSTKASEKGLIVHTTVTIGYDVPWKKMHQALIQAALRTEWILKDPEPFVLQTSLDDFFVSYQINAYTNEPNKQATIYSQLHQNIQDCCNEVGIEILSPHYRYERDGNRTTIPEAYLSKDYEAPVFNVKIKNQDGK